MSDLFEQPDDAATPLASEEMRDLIPGHIAYRRELSENHRLKAVATVTDWKSCSGQRPAR